MERAVKYFRADWKREILGQVRESRIAPLAAQHPLDRELRARLRQYFTAHGQGAQADFARRIERNQSWLHKYANGAGHASIDDAIRMVAVLSGLAIVGLTEREARLLRAWRHLPQSGTFQEDALELFEQRVQFELRKLQRKRGRESTAPVEHTTPETKRRVRGTP
jgi:hypothetical protein